MTLPAKATLNSTLVRPVGVDDLEFLFWVYASTREEEMRLTGWGIMETEHFLRMQFALQHTEYLRNYPGASFGLVLVEGEPAGRLYVHRRKDEIRIVDISLLPQFRGIGIGSTLLEELIGEADDNQLALSLHVERHNPAISLYERFGFRKGALSGIYHYMERAPLAPAKEGSSPSRVQIRSR